MKLEAVELSKKTGFYKTLLDNAEFGVITTDNEGYIVYMNRYYADFLGIPMGSASGMHITRYVPNSRMEIVASSGVPEINHVHEFINQHTSTIVHRVPIYENGRVIAVFGIIMVKSSDSESVLEKLSLLNTKIKMYEDELKSLRSVYYTFDKIIGSSEDIKAIRKEAEKAANNNFPVLITGESGTGKELIAQSIHNASARGSSPFVRINCAAIPRELFESELFGYEKGSFTGASHKGKVGKFELANKGTVFLDEIGDMPLELQPKLLRVLELKEFERIGGNKIIKSDFRIIAATNRPLESMMKSGEFRQDLFFRLNVIPIRLTPLRDRRDDVAELIHHFVAKTLETNKMYDRKIKFSSEALDCLVDYDWPGNTRELQNIIDRTLATLESDRVELTDLPLQVQIRTHTTLKFRHNSLSDYMEDIERKLIKDMLKSTQGNKTLAAEKLGIHRTLLYKKMRKLSIPQG